VVDKECGQVEIYGARVGGGYVDAVKRGKCEGEACQGAASAPEDATAASSAFRGPGNRKPAKKRKRCRMGERKAKRKGKVRCVKKHHKRKKRKHKRHRRARGSLSSASRVR
jgi:hypothetical protein